MKINQFFVCTIVIFIASNTAAFASENNKFQTSDSLLTTQMKVRGITCATDLKMIAANVQKLPGIVSFTPGKQGTTTIFDLQYNRYLVSEKEIQAAIENTGSCELPDERPYKVKK